MTERTKGNASGQAGVSVAGGQAKATKQNTLFECNAKHISKLCRELASNGLGLASTNTEIQAITLLKVLKYLGPRGLNTYEGTAAGYARLATRVFELEEDGWLITSQRESLIGPDGLFHPGVARYVLLGQRADFRDCQLSLGLEVAA